MSKVSTNWKTISQKKLLENNYMSIWEDQVEQPDGKIATYFVNRREPFSIIIPYHDGKVYLIKQYRYAVETISLEFPMGYVEGLGPLETAIRELKEETGITATQLVALGKFWVGVGRTDQVAYVYLASHLSFGEQELEEGEFITVEPYTLAEVAQMIENGAILDGPSIVAFHYLKSYIQSHSL